LNMAIIPIEMADDQTTDFKKAPPPWATFSMPARMP
jgi:hypothetical protein